MCKRSLSRRACSPHGTLMVPASSPTRIWGWMPRLVASWCQPGTWRWTTLRSWARCACRFLTTLRLGTTTAASWNVWSSPQQTKQPRPAGYACHLSARRGSSWQRCAQREVLATDRGLLECSRWETLGWLSRATRCQRINSFWETSSSPTIQRVALMNACPSRRTMITPVPIWPRTVRSCVVTGCSSPPRTRRTQAVPSRSATRRGTRNATTSRCCARSGQESSTSTASGETLRL
mmetsp:Transcript_9184/g.25666  ORF Transcript_9184/g.25666 Transcript_9184/m.25666 type:complete len:235 (-) Transcript_9184:182-886(-)